MSTNFQVKKAVKLALAVNAGLVGFGSTQALAQEEGAEELEEVIVTGSRIRKQDFVSNAPVATVGVEQIELTNTINAESLLNTLPQTVPGFDRTSNNPGNGTASVDLRGLGANRTLVLMDGKRVVPTSSGGVVDINNIPSSLIQSVEVLTGGASAIYGSDAVAGVVNFIMKDDFEGVAVNAGYEVTEEGDAALKSADITIGANMFDGRGNVALNFGMTDRDDLFQGDRDFAFFAQFDDTDADGNPILIDGGSSGIPGTSIFNGGLSDFSSNTGVTFDPDGSVRPFRTGETNDFYNYAPVNYIQLPQTRYQAMALGNFDIAESTTFYGRAMFTSSKVPQQLAPTPIFQTTTFSLDGSPFLTPSAQATLSGDNSAIVGIGNRQSRVFSDGASAFNETNTCTNCVFDGSFVDADEDGLDDDTRLDTAPLVDTDGDGIADTATGFVRRRLLEVGPRIDESSSSSYQIQAGLTHEFNDTWNVDAYVQYGNTNFDTQQSGNVSRLRFNQALLLDLDADPTGGTCQDTSANGATISCAPINIFGEGNISADGAEFLRTAVAASADYEQVNVGLNFSGDSSDMFELPGGAIGMAFGFEHREDEFAFRPSQDLATGNIAGFNGSPAVSGGFDVDEFYAEFYLPILAGESFAELLDLELAFRSSDYSTVGSVDTYKISGSWAPTDQFRFRGGFNRAVRAPNIGELFQPQAEGFPGAEDPCSAEGVNQSAEVRAICVATGVPAAAVFSPALNAAAGQVRGIFGGNPDLTEESADTFTAGVVVTPAAIEGLSFSIDYFDIEIEDAVASFGGGVSNVLNTCYDPSDAAGGVGSEFCNVINRRADGTIDNVAVLSQNVAFITLKGVDLIASYDTQLWGGDLRINYVGTFTSESDFLPFEGAQVIECAGNFGLDCGEPVPEYKHRMTFNWARDNYTAQLSWRQVGEVNDDDDGTTYFVETIDAQPYFDVVGSYQFNDNYSVSVGIDNLLDEEPPILGDNQEQANTWPATYDVFGRTWFVRASAEF